MAHTVEFESAKEVDLSRLEYPQVAVFSNLDDYPGKAVAKIMDSGKETNMMIVGEDLVTLHRDIRKYTELVWYWRGKDDVPELVGMFL